MRVSALPCGFDSRPFRSGLFFEGRFFLIVFVVAQAHENVNLRALPVQLPSDTLTVFSGDGER